MIVGGLGGLVAPTRAAEADVKLPTAFELIEQGNPHVEPHCRGKVVLIRSEKSTGGLTPTEWTVVYYDVLAKTKAVEVQFKEGVARKVKSPFRLGAVITHNTSPLNRNFLKIDSDTALQTALREPELKSVQLVASRMKLGWNPSEHMIWTVELFARKLNNVRKTAFIGEIVISAENGKVLANDLRVENVY